jgi:rhodanese-related sulfurtransferase
LVVFVVRKPSGPAGTPIRFGPGDVRPHVGIKCRLRIGQTVVAEIEPEELANLVRSGASDLLLLDVREDEERETARIEPSVHIPMNEVPGRLGEIPTDRRVVVYCHHGHRSALVAGYLEGQGYSRVLNLTGGIDAWAEIVDTSVPRY